MSKDAASAAQGFASRPDQSAWVSANAGSGKTTVLTSRVARLLLGGALPGQILCLTYTKAAAAVMQERLFRHLGRWSMLPPAELRSELAGLGESPEDLSDAHLLRARTLFASALETPGGLKIQTIHAFCDSVLRRFPLEAGVAPDFQLMDEMQSGNLLRETIAEVAEDEPAIFAALAANLDAKDDSLGKLVTGVLSNRTAFLDPKGPENLRLALGLTPQDTLERLWRDTVENSTWANLTAMQEVLSRGSSKDIRTAEKLALLLSGFDQVSSHGILEKMFIYGPGTKKAAQPKIDDWATGETRKLLALEQDAINALATRLADNRQKRLALQAQSASEALYAFAGEFLRRYDQRKSAESLLDFDDQIARVRDLLLKGDAAQWVLWKLDGGVSHILVDEAQDTSPEQWDVVKALADDFFRGAGAHGESRTVFAVGDEKQSIYSFQGADPRVFGQSRQHFARLLDDLSEALQDCELLYSFRSSPPILELVDRVAGPLMPSRHLAVDEQKAGRVEVWDLVTPDLSDAEAEWFDPRDLPADAKSRRVLAQRLAQWLRNQLDRGVPIPAKGEPRALRPGDILILVRTRGELYRALMAEMKRLQLPVSGADRFMVTAELAAKDVLSLLRFIASPTDDLSLAEALRSPLCGLGEGELFSLAWNRGSRSLWQVLQSRRDDFPTAVAMLESLRNAEGFAGVSDLIHAVLITHGGLPRLIRRLGRDAADAVEALLAQALEFDNSDPGGLTGFLHRMESESTEVKRQLDDQGGVIRVMTVHGAKGQEAPLVILPDTMEQQAPGSGVTLLALGDDAMLWAHRTEDLPQAAEEAKAEAARLQEAERHRLMYVAMTRAESWLVVAGAQGSGKGRDAWYPRIAEAIAQMDPQRTELGQSVSFRWPESAPALPAATAGNSATAPDWAFAAVPTPQPRPGPLSPSQLGGVHALVAEGPDSEDDAGTLRGSRIHHLLQVLPGSDPAGWSQLGARALGQMPEPPDPADFGGLISEAAAVIGNPAFSWIFGPGSLAEVPFTAMLGDRRLAGRIDRLVVTPEKVLVIDYKSNRFVPGAAAKVPEGILRQLGAYARAMAQIFPGRTIETAILWTKCATLMPVPQNIVMQALSRWQEP